MIKIATIEDEENIRQEIVRYIKKGIGSIEGVEVDVYESAERYLLVGGRYDLVISDIELPGISGLELGKRIKENNFKGRTKRYLPGIPDIVRRICSG